MSHNAYPVSTDLDAFLTAAGIDPTGLPTGAAIESAVASFEQDTGRLPFLNAGGSSTPRYFDPPVGPSLVLDLNADVVSVSDVSINGKGQVADTNYWLEPYNNGAVNRPYYLIRFNAYFWVLRWQVNLPQWKKSIVVTGVWGYCTSLPNDVWEALLQKGAAILIPQISVLQSDGVKGSDIGDLKIDYGDAGDLMKQGNAWSAFYQMTVNRYKRVTQ